MSCSLLYFDLQIQHSDGRLSCKWCFNSFVYNAAWIIVYEIFCVGNSSWISVWWLDLVLIVISNNAVIFRIFSSLLHWSIWWSCISCWLYLVVKYMFVIALVIRFCFDAGIGRQCQSYKHFAITLQCIHTCFQSRHKIVSLCKNYTEFVATVEVANY